MYVNIYPFLMRLEIQDTVIAAFICTVQCCCLLEAFFTLFMWPFCVAGYRLQTLTLLVAIG